MAPVTAATAQLCGHRWPGTPYHPHHDCHHPIGHLLHDIPLRHPPPCRCRCGATTTREDTRHA